MVVYSVGDVLKQVKGNFTILKFIKDLSAPALERTLGFDAGRLSSGFILVALAENEILRPEEIELKASTRWSGGMVGLEGLVPKRDMETVLSDRGQNPLLLREKVCDFLSRRGPNTPAKIIPNLSHTDGMNYPDAEALGPGIRSGVPQFNLRVYKRFVVLKIL